MAFRYLRISLKTNVKVLLLSTRISISILNLIGPSSGSTHSSISCDVEANKRAALWVVVGRDPAFTRGNHQRQSSLWCAGSGDRRYMNEWVRRRQRGRSGITQTPHPEHILRPLEHAVGRRQIYDWTPLPDDYPPRGTSVRWRCERTSALNDKRGFVLPKQRHASRGPEGSFWSAWYAAFKGCSTRVSQTWKAVDGVKGMTGWKEGGKQTGTALCLSLPW